MRCEKPGSCTSKWQRVADQCQSSSWSMHGAAAMATARRLRKQRVSSCRCSLLCDGSPEAIGREAFAKLQEAVTRILVAELTWDCVLHPEDPWRIRA